MKIHYFPRYHTKENAVTANSMLLLNNFYKYSTGKFFSMLQNFLLEDEESPEIAINMQVAGKESTPDAVITQKSFKIVIETKVGTPFTSKQLTNHLKQFLNEDSKVLLTLAVEPMNKTIKDNFDKKLEDYNNEYKKQLITPIKHKNITFAQLVGAIEEYIDEKDFDMVEILDDFKQYCLEENLVSNRHTWMRAVTAGTTMKDNIEFKLYYDRACKNYSAQGYIGLYSNKAVHAIGKVEKIAIAYYESGKFKCVSEGDYQITNDEKERIKQAIDKSQNYSYDLMLEPHRFFLVDEFYPTNFIKNSKNGIQKSKLFNLCEMLKTSTLPETKDIANALQDKCWEDFN